MDVNEIIELKRQGLSVAQISGLTGFDRKRIGQYLRNPRAGGVQVESCVQGFRAVVGLRVQGLPGLPSSDEGEGGVGGGLCPEQLPGGVRGQGS